jgi:hypothetical protein
VVWHASACISTYAIPLTPLLPNNLSLWGVNLVTQLHALLLLDLQELLLALTHPMHHLANLATLTPPLSSQKLALHTVFITAVRHHGLLDLRSGEIHHTHTFWLTNSIPHLYTALVSTPATVLSAPTTTIPPAIRDHARVGDGISAFTRGMLMPSKPFNNGN